MRIVLASRNRHKLEEIRGILSGSRVEVVSLDEYLGAPDVLEDGRTFEENARKKAVAVCGALRLPALSDDSGLEVEALDGEPGVRSARYAGMRATQRQLIDKLLAALSGVPDERRAARFVCVAVLAVPAGFPGADGWPGAVGADGCACVAVRGECAGVITREPRGTHGFGYDPVFFVPSERCTMAELSPERKNGLSHRAAAFRGIADFVRAHSRPGS